MDAINLTELITGQRELTQAVNNLIAAIQAAFPQADAAVTLTANAGAGVLPAAPSKFLSLTIAGTAYKVPLYLP